MDTLAMVKIELDIRIEKLKEFELEAEVLCNNHAYSRFNGRRLELESIKDFIMYHEHNEG